MKKIFFLVLILVSVQSFGQKVYQWFPQAYEFADSIKLRKYKNNLAGDSILSTDTSGRVIQVLKPIVSSTPDWQTVLIAGSTLTQSNQISIGGTNNLVFDTYNDNTRAYSWMEQTDSSFKASTRDKTSQDIALFNTFKSGSTPTALVSATTQALGHYSAIQVNDTAVHILPNSGNIYIDTLDYSANADDSMMVWRTSTGKAGMRAIPTGGGGTMTSTDSSFYLTGSGAKINARWWYNIKDYGAIPNDGLDDGAAIQAAINACHTAGGGTVYFPIGVWDLTEAPERLVVIAPGDTLLCNSQIYIPMVKYDADTNQYRGIRLLGESPSSTEFQVVAAFPNPMNGTVINSTYIVTTDDAGGYSRNVIGALSYGTPSFNYWNYTTTTVQDIKVVVATKDGSGAEVVNKMSGISFEYCAKANLKGTVSIRTSSAPEDQIDPHIQSNGYIGPEAANHADSDNDNLFVSGFYHGVKTAEHSSFKTLVLNANYYGVTIRPYYKVIINSLITENNAYTVKMMDESNLSILGWSGEINTTPGKYYSHIADVTEATSGARGTMVVQLATINNTGVPTTPTKIGDSIRVLIQSDHYGTNYLPLNYVQPTAINYNQWYYDSSGNNLKRWDGDSWENFGAGGGGGSGTVNSGTQYRLGYYATTGTSISEAASITASRVLISDANGVPTHSTVTSTTLGYLDATSSIQTQINSKISGLVIGTTPITSGTEGNILWQGSGGLLQQSNNLYWEGVQSQLGLGTQTPSTFVSQTGITGSLVNVYNSTAYARLYAQGALGGLFALADLGAGSNVKQMQFRVDGGVATIEGVNDAGSAITYTFAGFDLSNGRVGIGAAPTTDQLEVTGNLSLMTAGNKLKIATGSNASIGVSGAMTAGSITISTTAVTASSKIFLTHASLGGTQGILSVGTITAGTSFVINSSDAADTGTVNWWIIN